jgi:hypothetical protein
MHCTLQLDDAFTQGEYERIKVQNSTRLFWVYVPAATESFCFEIFSD